MAFSLDKILNSDYLPHWLEECEIQQGTFDITEDITLDETNQTYTSDVFGISNRPLYALYAISKILAKISRNHHYENGSHHIVDSDVENNALIKESPDVNNDGVNDPSLTELRKLALDFYGRAMPDEATPKDYSTTVQLAEKIDALYQYIDLLRKGLGSSIAFRYSIQDFIELDLKATGFKVDPFTIIEESNRSEFIINSSDILINGKVITLKNSNNVSLNGDNILTLSSPLKTIPSVPQAEVIYLELYLTHLTDSHVPYGNRNYGDDEVVTPGSTTLWLPYISDKVNNIFIDPSFYLSQLQYKVSSSVFDPSISSYGVDQLIINSQPVTKTAVRGIWKAGDTCLVFPLMAVANRNLGIYHPAINPGGTATKRAGSTISSIEDCFNTSLISYYSVSGVECPNYAVYSNLTDTYVHLSTSYYRSGLFISLVTGNPLGYYADKVYLDDIVTLGKQLELNSSSMLNNVVERILGNDLYTELNPTMKGLASNMLPGSFYSRNPLQVIGFGETEETLFGFDNKGGVFIDECNNETEGTTDEVRTYWGDPSCTVSVSFSFIEGNNNSESRPFLTYEPISQVVTLNTTSLSGVPNISATSPIMTWDDGTLVALETAWTGLGTTSAQCVIIGRTGRKVYGLVNFTYRLGSGIPYILDGVTQVLDLLGNSYNFCIQKSENYCLGCKWVGNPDSGDTDHLVLPTCIDCDSPTDIIGSYAYVLDGSNAGLYRAISQYDCESRVVLFETAFPDAILSTDKISIGKLEPEHTTIVINPFARGVTGAFKRQRILTTSTKYFSTLPLIDFSEGTVSGTVLKDLVNATYIEVTTREDEPLTSGFYVYTKCNPIFNQYKSIADCSMNIIKPGVIIDTTKGSANSPFTLYRQFVPTYSTKVVDATKWISTDCESPYFKIKPIEYWDINYSIRPTESLLLTVSDEIIVTNKMKLGELLSIISDIEIPIYDNRLCMGVTLVEIDSWYYLLCTPRCYNTFGLDRGYLLDINKIY